MIDDGFQVYDEKLFEQIDSQAVDLTDFRPQDVIHNFKQFIEYRRQEIKNGQSHSNGKKNKNKRKKQQ